MRTFIARAPGRVSLAGGGTDLPVFYERRGGAVATVAIRRYAFAEISERADALELLSRDRGTRETIRPEKYERRIRYPFLAEEFLTLSKAVAWHFRLDRARIAVSSDLPPGGGLGSSASVAVALITAAAEFVGTPRSRSQVAELAARVEMSLLRRPSGKQDPYVASYGGVMFLEFARDGSAFASPIQMRAEIKANLERHLLLFSNGSHRIAAGLLAELTRRCAAGDRQTMKALDELRSLAFQVRSGIESGNVRDVAAAVDAGWTAKRRLHELVASAEVDRLVSLAKDAGAMAAKLCGAGGSGALLVIAGPERQRDVQAALATQGWRAESVAIDDEGACLWDGEGREASV